MAIHRRHVAPQPRPRRPAPNAAIELPTAFPYFAAIAAIVGSGIDPARQVFLLVLFNVCFVAPLLAIFGVLVFAGEEAREVLSRARDKLQRNWPIWLAGLLFVAGAFVVLLGLTGLASRRIFRVALPGTATTSSAGKAAPAWSAPGPARSSS